MPKSLEVVILGKSLLVAGLAARLKDSSAFRVTYVELPIAATLAALAIIVPDVVIFDMQDADDASVGSLLFRFPGMKLIGLEGPEASLVVISSELKLKNMEDLTQAITGAMG
ncbi:MAG: hypothetical protein ABFC84_10190 [Veillonellales bacterium]